MARMYYERLSDESAGYLEAEGSRRRAHTAMILIFEGGPLATPEGGVDFARIREIVQARLPELPRLRSRLRRVPLDGHPVWVDDQDFNLDHHLRHSSLPRPGTHEQLSRTAARIAATRLDRSRPLWDCWVIEGLEEGRFALILKMHKALANLEGADLLRCLLSEEPDRLGHLGRSRAKPRPAPSPVELFMREVVGGFSPSRRAIARAMRLLQPGRASRELREQASVMLQVMGYRLRPASESPFDGNLGPHRAFAVQEVPLEVVQRMRHSLGGTVHDGVMTLLAGALRRFMAERHVSPTTVDLRALTPVLEGDGEGAHPWIVELPIWEPTFIARHDLVTEQTRRMRAGADATPAEVLSAGSDWNASRLFVIGARSLKAIDTGQMAVLLSPGPRRALFLEGARLRECYGILPLQDSSALGVTILSYAGSLFFAFNGDPDIVPDLRRLRDALDSEVSAVVGEVESVGPKLRAVASSAGE